MSADISLLTTKNVEIRPIDTLIRRTNEDGSIRIVSDVTLLFNEDRIINDLGEDNFRNLVRSMQDNPTSPYRDSGLTDDQMIETIKSRYLQAPSEVRAWLEKLVDKAEIVKSDYESLVEEYEAEMAAKAVAKAAADAGGQSSKTE
nr:MAG TPA: hypothetical protein [Microviridae sp.]